MTKPNMSGYDCFKGQIVCREMTDQEYADLLATGWTLESKDETLTFK
jgi:hypothetical protein